MSLDQSGQFQIKQTNIGSFNFPTALTGNSTTDNYAFSFQGVRGSGINLSHNATSRNIQIIAGDDGVVLAGSGTSFSAISSDERLKHNWIGLKMQQIK